MMTKRQFLLSGVAVAGLGAIGARLGIGRARSENAGEVFEVTKTPEEWKAILAPEQFSVLREEGTEYPGTSPLLEEHRKGIFACAGCDLPVFESDKKFDSGTGWPSFSQPVDEENVSLRSDNSLLMRRTEVVCSRCDAHLGHVFRDGPRREHRWESGWVPEAVALLLGPEPRSARGRGGAAFPLPANGTGSP